ncbi:hypothetical protein Tco_1387096, partial [Tanacetum coccineum]
EGSKLKPDSFPPETLGGDVDAYTSLFENIGEYAAKNNIVAELETAAQLRAAGFFITRR